ncbi:restriction endonuclease subunit S [Streptosporangium sp. NPDC000509]|uniref:restriction endonuclease subunit S n=1 Tax=Streptosporangium sp. NPDC000509 TaxID=3366186 RepID=UPI0036CF3E3D
MNAWESVPFGAAVTDCSSGSRKVQASDYASSGRLAIVDQGKELIAGFTDDLELAYRGELPVIVFGDHTRRFKYVDFPFCVGADGVKVLQPGPEFDSKFLYHFLSSLDIPSAGYSRHYKFLKDTQIIRPSIGMQRRIAEVLDHVDVLCTKRRKAIALLDDIIRSIFLDMFGTPTSNVHGMQVIPLGKMIKVRSGSFLPASAMQQDGNYPVFGGNGVNGKHDKYLFEEEKIVIGRVGVYCGCIHIAPPKSWITDNALYVSEKYVEVTNEYLARALVEANLNQYASKSAQPLISGARIKSIPIIIPPLSLQYKLDERIGAIRALKSVHERALTGLDALSASLQQRAFRGDLWQDRDI